MKLYTQQIFIVLLSIAVGVGCDFELPEESSVPDVTFPVASFTTTVGSNHREIIFTNTTNNEATGFIWDFGDGASFNADLDSLDVIHEYDADGVYDVTLTAFDNNGVESDTVISLSIYDETPPFASFDIAQLDSDFTVVTFYNLSGNASAYLWDFGDGIGTSEEANPVYHYTDAVSGAEFEVTLTAIDELEESADTTITITVVDDPTRPIANFTSETVGLTVFFTNVSERATEYHWDFGDGNTSEEFSPSHRFETEGSYNVTLTATSGGSSTSLTQVVIADRFVPVVLNGTFDEFTAETGDNADAWDMTPNSTVIDNSGTEIESPYAPLWDNEALNAYIDATYCSDEQPNSSADGAFVDGEATRGGKFSSNCRRLYQVVDVIAGEEYTFSIDTRSEAEGINTEVFLLNEEITTETVIDADLSTDNDVIDGYLDITNDFNASKGDASTNTFTRSLITFTPTNDIIVIYVRALNAIDGTTEVFIDNIAIN